MNDTFIENLYTDMTNLFHLDQIRVTGEDGEAEPAESAAMPLPTESRVLLGAICGIWIVIGIVRWKEHQRQAKRTAKS